jgi:short-subunit dehydrogenase
MTPTSNKRFAVVTGASSGIGYELAAEFARNGFDLLIAAESERIADAADRLSQLGAQVDYVRADLATWDGVEELVARIDSSGRAVDAAAINAGVGISGDFAQETDLREELNLINLNVISPVHLAKRLLPDMVARRQGRVLFTASIAGTMPGPFVAVYNASKAFVKSFAEAIRNELKDSGVTVTTLMPGATETEFFERAGLEDTKLGASENKDDAAKVAKDGYEALMAGKDHIVAGSFMNKLQTVAAHILPDTVMAELHRKQSEPGTASK